ncbi:GCN5-related N-acetyltransferase [Qipengyuania atrilutea]|uniref:GCN5-related N-acetyltransferase n=1 Tax=Qipengyuania atrilutea TaxID=2744473 RepID=A0A850H017_9SPHN|nr:GCN5-related N-acetyltransferase [Actirhodobacter atriluteus]NVD44066.1 GCN5-related N-acetyltransferase [Actirhodobacter atriluteus]
MSRQLLLEEWLQLTREAMPALAKRRRWPVRFDHCFQRILLDNAVGGRWYDHIESPAYRNASDAQLRDAIALGKAAIKGNEDLAALNRKSLEWRGQL